MDSPQSPHSPHSDRSSTTDSSIRKRVGRACDRCRMKKSKCDGNTPCGRCKTDNTLCEYGERKKASDKPYPKGYVEMLETNQASLVAGLQAMYTLLLEAGQFPGGQVEHGTAGQPLTHHILKRLHILKDDDQEFEEDPDKLRATMESTTQQPEGERRTSKKRSRSPDLELIHSPASQRTSLGSAPPTAPQTPSMPQFSDFSMMNPLQIPQSNKEILLGGYNVPQHVLNQQQMPQQPQLGVWTGTDLESPMISGYPSEMAVFSPFQFSDGGISPAALMNWPQYEFAPC